MVKFAGDGSLQVNIDPNAMACEKEHGLLVSARRGSAVIFYDLLADGAMNGKVDPNTLYQFCGDKGLPLFFVFCLYVCLPLVSVNVLPFFIQ